MRHFSTRGAAHDDATYASRVYRVMFPGSAGGGSSTQPFAKSSTPESTRAAAFSDAYAAGTAIKPMRQSPRGAYRRPVILVIGDSLVQRGFVRGGWVGSLANAHARTADVLLRGYAGYNTRWVRELMEHEPGLFPDKKDVAVVVLLLGANDAVLRTGRKHKYGVTVETYEANLRWILQRYDGKSTIKILCTPPPIDQEERLRITTEVRGMPADLLDRSSDRLAKFADAARGVARDTKGVTMADLHEAFKQAGLGWEKRLLSDGLHFTEQGQALAFETVSASIAAAKVNAKNALFPFAYDAPTHETLIGANNTDDWHGHLVVESGNLVVVER
jgi:lysophospholipase L1-like esterase